MTLVRKKSLAAAAGMAAAIICLGLWLSTSKAQVNPPIRLAALESPPAVLSDLSQAFISVAEKVRPAVVSINVKEVIKTGAGGMGQSEDPFAPFRDFFGDDFMPGPRQFRQFRMPEEIPRYGVGSGVIVDAEHGYILTNNHVVGKASKIEVKLNDERTFDAEVVGADKSTDLALIKVKPTGRNKPDHLVGAPLGDSDALRVGEIVMAVGSPFQLAGTVTQGIVSAKGRTSGILGRNAYENFIQTDAAVNPGNSGGPLVNLHGEVVGINTAIATGTGAFAGVSFAIPINMARNVMEDLTTKGKVSRGWIGVEIRSLDPAFARRYGMDTPHGALISRVVPGAAGETAGLRDYDVVTELNGKEVHDADAFRFDIGAMKPGEKARLKVLRDGQTKEFIVKLAERPGEEDLDAQQSGKPKGSNKSERSEVAGLGLSVQTLTPAMSQELQTEIKEGVVVTNIDSNGPSAESGLRPGAIITEVEKQPVKSAAQFEDIAGKALKEHDSVILRGEMQGNPFMIILESNAK